jgi:hypothetical protein
MVAACGIYMKIFLATDILPCFLAQMSGATTAPASQPSRVGGLIGLVRKLIDYGTFLANTLRQRGLGNHPAIQGRLFGTTNVTLILARIARGLMRAAALEARLHRSAAHLDGASPSRASRARAASATTKAAVTTAPRRHANPRNTDDDDALLAQMPTEEQIAEEIRRRPIGEVIADICRDLGIVPAHPLWRELHNAIMREGGRFAALVIDILKRPGRVPRPEDWPDELPPFLWADWRHDPTQAATGPP